MTHKMMAAGLGILGGMGPRATTYFTNEVLSAVEHQKRPRRDQDYPSFVVRYACHVPDRTTAILSDRSDLLTALALEAATLVGLGCSQIVMPCVTAHALLDQPGPLSEFPFLDIRLGVGDHIATEFPRVSRVGVLCTQGTRVSNTSVRFAPAGCEAVHLDPDDEAELMGFIYDQAKTWSGAQEIDVLLRLGSKLRSRGCDLIIAGCTELEMYLAQSPDHRNDFIFPLRTVATRLVSAWVQ